MQEAPTSQQHGSKISRSLQDLMQILKSLQQWAISFERGMYKGSDKETSNSVAWMTWPVNIDW